MKATRWSKRKRERGREGEREREREKGEKRERQTEREMESKKGVKMSASCWIQDPSMSNAMAPPWL